MKFKQVIAATLFCFAAAACSNNDSVINEENNLNQEALVINLKNLNQSSTRVLGDPSTSGENSNTLKLAVNKVEVNLTAEKGGTNGWLTVYEGVDKNEANFESSKSEVRLFDVKNPTNLKVRINHTEATTSNTYSKINDFQVAKAQMMPGYGVTTKFTPNVKSIVNNTTSTKYEVIGATVNVEIPTARIELSNINLATSQKFTAINLNKIFINNVFTAITANDGSSTFNYSEKVVVKENDLLTALPNDVVNESVLDNATLTEKTYAYSVFPTFTLENLPKITFQFNNITLAEGANSDATRYAVITKMKSGGAAVEQVEAGKIYRLKNISLTDDVIGVDIDGNSLYAVEVEVIIPSFEFVDVDDIEWN